MDSPAPLTAHDPEDDAAPLSAIERFVALMDALCAALLVEMAPRTWLGGVFRRLSCPLAAQLHAALCAISDRLRAFALEPCAVNPYADDPDPGTKHATTAARVRRAGGQVPRPARDRARLLPRVTPHVRPMRLHAPVAPMPPSTKVDRRALRPAFPHGAPHVFSRRVEARFLACPIRYDYVITLFLPWTQVHRPIVPLADRRLFA